MCLYNGAIASDYEKEIMSKMIGALFHYSVQSTNIFEALIYELD